MEKIGIVILSTRAFLRSGAGLVSIHAPKCTYPILQSTVPEAMISIDRHEYFISELPDIKKYKAIGVKGGHSCLSTPEGKTYFNSTGNPGMATDGSGDVLTGILTGLIAQGYGIKEAALVGMLLHGRAGDLAVEEMGSEEALLASDLVDYLSRAFGSGRK